MERKVKTFVGVVRSTKMQKTIVVEVATRRLHHAYEKYITRVKRYKAHDEQELAVEGDRVSIIESRPVSKEKCWRLLKILENNEGI